jgi:serine/threonine-protein kinase
MEGKILGNRYELIEKIGGGGMAIVYKDIEE